MLKELNEILKNSILKKFLIEILKNYKIMVITKGENGYKYTLYSYTELEGIYIEIREGISFEYFEYLSKNEPTECLNYLIYSNNMYYNNANFNTLYNLIKKFNLKDISDFYKVFNSYKEDESEALKDYMLYNSSINTYLLNKI
ncbi:TPA: hypothetical protein UL242_002536 [Clostridioides difficile]|uniref:Uncharacterized protein n=1 Tax=Clostridioides difficile TaxID=1496 RepID=A0AAN6A7Z0_CLODI|nr:hypothetical protein [Clostridioides difficile]EGT3642192.1 hypothetical protein [Clostridioides difficile]EGT3944947.1 hypothetical protein [Clostridioides difficile]MBG0198878.1 hypothetical protein [Clostridioides difficile]MBH7168560.1 hypothetical protein [Clostridioides difficile]MBH7847415.1 hypothetical protein [Clostridioides difficile]